MHPAKYQCVQHANFNDLHTHTHTHTHIELANFFFRKNLPNINLLKLANFKNPHTYIYIYIYAICQISMYSTYQLKKST